MNICFCVELPCWESWDDGLRGAMKILQEDHNVHYHFDGMINDDCNPDIIFVWGGTLSKPYEYAKKYTKPKVLLFAGGPRKPEYFDGWDIVCFENIQHVIEGRYVGVNCIQAFGTDTNIFKPIKQPKIFDVVYPAAFGLWKRKDLFAESVKGLKALTFGNVQKHEPQCWDVCVENDIAVAPWVAQATTPYFMAMGKCIVLLPVPEIGCQRTALEAMAMKIPVIGLKDAPLITEFIHHGGIIVEPKPEEIRKAILEASKRADVEEAYKYVQDNFTEVHYANKLKQAIKRCLA